MPPPPGNSQRLACVRAEWLRLKQLLPSLPRPGTGVLSEQIQGQKVSIEIVREPNEDIQFPKCDSLRTCDQA